jgi:glyoxylase I family protein
MLNKIHHLAIICTDYVVSKNFYSNILGLKILKEEYRKERDSFKLDLALNDEYIIELFSFPNPPSRLSKPEASGLRHLAFEVNNLDEVVQKMNFSKIKIEPIRIDEFTGKRFTFIADPDDLPIEFYEK